MINSTSNSERVRWVDDEDGSDDAAAGVEKTIQALESHGERIDQQDRWRKFARAISNQEIEFDDTMGTVNSVTMDPFAVAWNGMYAADRALRAKIQRAKPRIQILTSDGSRKQRKQSKKLNQWIDGWFYQTDVGAQISKAHTDALRFDCGFVEIETDEGSASIGARHVRPWDVWVDHVDGVDGTPKIVYMRRWMTGQEVVDKYDLDSEHKLADAGRVPVYTAWVRATGDSEGRKIVTCRGENLSDECWEEQWIPLIPFRYETRPQSYWGQPPAEIIAPIQAEISRTLATIQSVHKKTIKPRTYLRNGTTLVQPLTNEDGPTYQVQGDFPKHETPQGLPPESYNWLNANWSKLFEVLGLNEQSAAGRKPVGITSAVGQREYNDTADGLFVLPAQEFEQGFVECAKVAIALAKKLYANPDPEKRRDVEIKAPGTSLLTKIKWSDVDLGEDWEMRPWPTSGLPKTPAALKDYVSDIFKDGFISKTTALSLFQFPDVEHSVNLELAGIEEVQDQIDRILDDGELTLPDEFTDLQSAVTLGKAELRKARNEPDINPKNIEKLKRWVREAMRLASPPAPPAAPQAAAPALPMTPAEASPLTLGAPGVQTPDVMQLATPGPVTPTL